MECHGLEMFGPIRSADDIDAIEIESVTGKVSLKVGLQFDVGTNPSTKTLAADTDGNASWQIRSAPGGAKMLFLQASPPTGWSAYTSFVDGSMLIYRHWTNSGYVGGDDDPTNWTTAITIDATDTSRHTHTMPGETDPGDYGRLGGDDDDDLSKTDHKHTYSGPTNTNDNNSIHNHNVGQDTWTPRYQEVILGEKD
jgi:hypothetical protein